MFPDIKGAASQLKRAEALFAEAEERLAAGDIPAALAAVRKSLVLAPRETRYRQLLARLVARPGNGQPAPPPMTLDDLPTLTDEGVTDAQRRELQAEASRCLAEIADLEALVEAQGLAGTPVAEIVTSGRERVQSGLQALNAARRQERAAPAPGPRVQPPLPQLHSPPRLGEPPRQALPPFTHTLGQVQGGVTEGPEVENLQRFLGTQGLAVTVTGVYDQQTTAAVRNLQQRLGLKRVNAVVGVETRQAFNRLLAQGPAAS